MKRKEESITFGKCVTASLFGGGISLLCIGLLTGLLAVVVLSGGIQEASLGIFCAILVGLAVLIGGKAACAEAGGRKLFVCVGTAGVSLLLVLLLKSLLFRGSQGSLLWTLAAAAAGAVLAFLLSGGKKRRRIR